MSNPYAVPDANLKVAQEPIQEISTLPRISAWLVFLFTFITGGIYGMYWLYHRSRLINQFSPKVISPVLINLTMFTYIASFAASFAAEDIVMIMINLIITLISIILYIVLLLAVKDRLNLITRSNKGDNYFISSIFTLLFFNIYLQYKINQIIDGES
ncbi:DUF4234 domain-containing protein [Endozoicomonas sp. SM1973]|uniref:DUF4234 domain-containing protein n=1 Tax=Spartinivicinus marinus TaxID=2994442 RepID=A0A853I4E6_9GAMM|nr:DUF4234 domain-containing protein [Spartinivicinus marinus]MCX4028253.1 DUF4234 domain-containing protein [Spartinivicinus marinus]NYZ65588.1 DUF4234 domain-containing protein [Spartinivicinus marinus]